MSEVWSSANTEGKYPGLLGRNTLETNYAYLWYSSLDPNNSFKDYDIWYKKINYLRVNSIRLGYTLPSKVAAENLYDACQSERGSPESVCAGIKL